MRTAEAENGSRLSGLTSDDEDYDDDDGGLAGDMEALRQACLITGKEFSETNFCSGYDSPPPTSGIVDSESEDDSDLELLRGIRQRFLMPDEKREPLSPKRMCAIDDDDDEEDDFEKLNSLQKRFGAVYDSNDATGGESGSKKCEEEQTSFITSEEKVSGQSLVGKTNAFRVVEDFEDTANTTDLLSDSMEMQPAGSQPSAVCPSSTVAVNHFRPPETFQLIFGAVKKNRSLQNILRSKLSQIEAKLEENNKLRKRVKILKDLQWVLRQSAGRTLAQGKDPRTLLISAQSTVNSKDSKGDDAVSSSICSGPLENSHVSNYRSALAKFPPLLERRKWEKSEDKKLKEGLQQQYQEMILQAAMEQFSSSGPAGNAEDLDNIVKSTGDLEMTPKIMKQFLPKVDWNKLAFMNVENRSGPECQARWLNSACPYINNSGWSKSEEKRLMYVIQSKGIHNWSEISTILGTNRTPFQCLERFQRSLNPRVLKSLWTKEEDRQLRAAVLEYGETDWQSVAATLKGRTGTQCSNRWLKSVSVIGKGHWRSEEDIRLKVAVKIYGPKDWKRVALFVPGRKDVQCRDRWHNVCSPSINRVPWTEEDDSRLMAAVEENGHCWVKVSHVLPGRTDNDCMRRWNVLFPEEVPLLKEARKIKKAALITNFVNREEERTALDLEDFIATPLEELLPESDRVDQSAKSKRKLRATRKKGRPKRSVKQVRGSSSQPPGGSGPADSGDAESCGGGIEVPKKRTVNHRRGKKSPAASVRTPPLRLTDKILLVYTRRKKKVSDSKNQSKESNVNTEKENEAALTKGIKACQKTDSLRGIPAEDEDRLSSFVRCVSKKRKPNSVAAVSDSEATISDELVFRETSSQMTVDSRRQTDFGSDYDEDTIPLSRLVAYESQKRTSVQSKAARNLRQDDGTVYSRKRRRAVASKMDTPCVSEVNQ